MQKYFIDAIFLRVVRNFNYEILVIQDFLAIDPQLGQGQCGEAGSSGALTTIGKIIF